MLGLTSLIALDPQNSGPNWSLCRDIEGYVAIKLSVFVAASIVGSCFSIKAYSLGLFLDCVVTYFDDVAI